MKRLILAATVALLPLTGQAAKLTSSYNAAQPEVTTCRFYFDGVTTAPVDMPVDRATAGKDRCVMDITTHPTGAHTVKAQYCVKSVPAGLWPDVCSADSNTVSFTVPGAPAIAPSGLSVGP